MDRAEAGRGYKEVGHSMTFWHIPNFLVVFDLFVSPPPRQPPTLRRDHLRHHYHPPLSSHSTNCSPDQAIMSGNLSSAAEDRKARLAALKSLKRKQPSEPTETDDNTPTEQDPAQEQLQDVSSIILSGRNYDAATRAPKLGFENDPSAQENTLERKAQELAETTKKQAEQEDQQDAPLDLFKLQPKKPNWDLKRDLDRKLDILNVRTDNAIAKLVRQRIAAAQAEKTKATGVTNNEGEAVGMEGAELLEATNLREKEAEEEARREDEAQADLLDGS